jgi:hypothetical protein
MSFLIKAPPDPEPGKTLERELLKREAHLRPKLLEAAERAAKERGDLEMLRAVKQYQEMSREIHPRPLS